jgi:hypothetical protein
MKRRAMLTAAVICGFLATVWFLGFFWSGFADGYAGRQTSGDPGSGSWAAAEVSAAILWVAIIWFYRRRGAPKPDD